MNDKLPILETKRLLLREIDFCDAEDMFEYAKISYVGPSAGWQPHTSINDTKAIIKIFHDKKKFGQLGVYAVILKENNKMIGTIELHTYTPNFKAELGYTINPNYWGNGYAVEASKKVIAYGFNRLNLKRIECSAFTNNTQSRRVCEKLQLTCEGIRRKGYQLYNGIIGDLACYSIIDDEYYTRLMNNSF